MELRVGDKAPDFTLPRQDGTQVTQHVPEALKMLRQLKSEAASAAS